MLTRRRQSLVRANSKFGQVLDRPGYTGNLRIPEKAPQLSDLLAEAGPARLPAVIDAGILATDGDRYRHWDTLRHIPPPGGLSAAEWWLGIKIARRALAHDLPLRTVDGLTSTYGLPDPVLQMTHRSEGHAGDEVAMGEVAATPEARDRYVVSSLIEEVVTSSQLEGASSNAARGGRHAAHRSSTA
jgi:hypothetical protein